MNRPLSGVVLVLALLVSTPALAGCLGEEDPETQPRPSPPDDEDGGESSPPGTGGEDPREQPRLPAPFLLRASACHSSTVLVPANEEVAAGHLPDGFSTVPLTRSLGGPEGVPAAGLQVLTIRCEEGGVLGSAEGGASLHLLALVVDVPEAYASQATRQELFLVAGIAGQEPVGEAFGERGWAVTAGTVSLTVTSTPLGGGLLEASGEDATNGTSVAGTFAPENTTDPPGLLRVWHAPADRLEYLHLAIGAAHPVSNGTATVRTQAAQGPTADLLGPGAAGRLALAGPYNVLASPVLVERALAP